MDAPEKLLTLKQALTYLDATHGLRFSVVAMRVKRAKGTGPEFFRPTGMRDLRTTARQLDAWVAACMPTGNKSRLNSRPRANLERITRERDACADVGAVRSARWLEAIAREHNGATQVLRRVPLPDGGCWLLPCDLDLYLRARLSERK